jgi:uncharacterized glyoxalase superfamily metalloenzyme YdcJ
MDMVNGIKFCTATQNTERHSQSHVDRLTAILQTLIQSSLALFGFQDHSTKAQNCNKAAKKVHSASTDIVCHECCIGRRARRLTQIDLSYSFFYEVSAGKCKNASRELAL